MISGLGITKRRHGTCMHCGTAQGTRVARKHTIALPVRFARIVCDQPVATVVVPLAFVAGVGECGDVWGQRIWCRNKNRKHAHGGQRIVCQFVSKSVANALVVEGLPVARMDINTCRGGCDCEIESKIIEQVNEH